MGARQPPAGEVDTALRKKRRMPLDIQPAALPEPATSYHGDDTVAVSVKVGALRAEKEYADFAGWLSDANRNLYVGRPGRIFIHDAKAGTKRIFHYKGSKWQNPFVVGRDGNREQVCNLYRAAILDETLRDPVDDVPLRKKLPELRGLRLGCWCKP